MKMIKKIFTLITLVVSVAFVLSCKQNIEDINIETEINNELQVEKKEVVDSDYSVIKVSADEKTYARTALPSVYDLHNDKSISIVFKGSTENSEIPEAEQSIEKKWIYKNSKSAFDNMKNSESFNVRKSTWTFELLVYKSETLIFYNKISEKLISDENVNINFGTLNDIGFANGSISYRLYFPEGSQEDIVKYVFVKRGDDVSSLDSAFETAEECEVLLDAEKNQKYVEISKSDLESGYQRLYFRIYNSIGVIIGTWQELVLIASNNISQRTASISALDIYQHIYYENAESWNGVNCSINNSILVENFNIAKDIELAKSCFTNPYYKVEGLYDNPDFTGKPVTQILANTKNSDVTLYVKWVLNEIQNFDLANQAIIEAKEEKNDIFWKTGNYHYENGICKYFQMAPGTYSLEIPVGLKMETVKFDSEAYRIVSLGKGSEIDYLKIPYEIRYLEDNAPEVKINVLEISGNFNSGKFFEGIEVNTIKTKSTEISSGFKDIKNEFKFEFTDEVTTIKQNAFTNTKVKEIIIPKSVTEISKEAFSDAAYLKKVIFEDDSQLVTIRESAFKNDVGITEIELPASVTSIGSGVFYDCTNLKKIIINSQNATLGNYIFNNCENLEVYAYNGVLTYGPMQYCKSFTLTIMGEPETLADKAFSLMSGMTQLTLPDSITTFGKNLCENCTSLTKFIIPEKVTSIPINAFYGCTSLSEIEGLSSISSVGDNAFTGCTSLTEISFPESVTSIGVSALFNCKALEKVTLGSNITSIGKDAFKDCTQLKTLCVEDFDSFKLVNFGNAYSNPIYYTHSVFQDDTEVTEYVVPTGRKYVNSRLCEYWNGLTKVYLPESVTSFSSSDFPSNNIEFIVENVDLISTFQRLDYFKYKLDVSNCTSLTELTGTFSVTNSKLTGIKLPETITEIPANCFKNVDTLEYCIAPGVTIIKNSAFLGCYELGKVEFGELSSIGDSAFNTCHRLKEIYAPNITTLGSGAFCNLGTVKITMPLSKVTTGLFTDSKSIDLILTGTESKIDANKYYISSSSDTNYQMINGLTLPESVTEIGNYAFNYWRGLKKIKLGKFVTSVGEGAFKGSQLEELYLGESLVSIGQFAFGYKELQEIDLPITLTTLGKSCFQRIGIDIINKDPIKVHIGYDLLKNLQKVENNLNKVVTGPYAVEIKASSGEITEIGAGIFKDYTNLQGVEIPDTVTEIGSSAFSGCTGLTTIELSSKIELINYSTFLNCTSLEKIEIPASVTKIYDDAFKGCEKLSEVSFNGENLTTIYDGAFADCSPNLEMTYPESVIFAPYKIKYMLQNLEDDGYTLYKSEYRKAEKVEKIVRPNSSYAPSLGKVTENSKVRNSTDSVVYFYYDRPIVTLTINLEGGYTTTPLIDGNKLIGKAGASIGEFVTPVKDVEPGEKQVICIGFNDYDQWLPSVFPAEDAEYTVIWGDRDKPGAPGNFNVVISKVDGERVATVSWTAPSDDDILCYKVVMKRPGGAVVTYSVDNPKATGTTISGVNLNSTSGSFEFYCYAVDTSRNKGTPTATITRNLQ